MLILVKTFSPFFVNFYDFQEFLKTYENSWKLKLTWINSKSWKYMKIHWNLQDSFHDFNVYKSGSHWSFDEIFFRFFGSDMMAKGWQITLLSWYKATRSDFLNLVKHTEDFYISIFKSVLFVNWKWTYLQFLSKFSWNLDIWKMTKVWLIRCYY